MFEVNGLPLHVLLVHITVVFVPLAALCTILSVAWPTARRRLGVVTPLIALAALILVPITGLAGQWLHDRVTSTPLIEAHAALGLNLIPWTIAVFAIALIQWLWFRFATPDGQAGSPMRKRPARTWITVVIAAAAIVASVGATVTVVQIGESGSRAIWQGSFRETP